MSATDDKSIIFTRISLSETVFSKQFPYYPEIAPPPDGRHPAIQPTILSNCRNETRSALTWISFPLHTTQA